MDDLIFLISIRGILISVLDLINRRIEQIQIDERLRLVCE
jgi:hypothetical protein